MAAKKTGLEKVPVIIKKFDSRDETIEYEYKMQLNSRRLTDGEYFAAFLKLYEIRRSNPNAQYAKPFVQTLFSKINELSSHRFCLQSVCYQTCFVNFIRSFVAQPLMNPFTIEELYKFPETFSQFLCT